VLVGNILVARAASVRLRATSRYGSEAVGKVVGNNPWGLVRAHVSITAVASGCCVEVCQRGVVLVANGDRVRDISLVRPRA
jgi:hypothetical protein